VILGEQAGYAVARSAPLQPVFRNALRAHSPYVRPPRLAMDELKFPRLPRLALVPGTPTTERGAGEGRVML
jgi:hypothetical protein